MGQQNRSTTNQQALEIVSGVELPSSLYDRIDDRVERSEFDSVDEYVAFVLEEVLSRVENETKRDETVDTVDRAEIETRLASLGYLD